MRLRPVILGTAVLALAGCGGEKTVLPRPSKVVGSVPKQTTSTPSAGGTTSTTGGGGGGGGGGAASGKALFTNNGCVSCHTYKPAGSNAKVGPDLDKLATYAKQAKKPLAAFTQESIVSPDAYVQPGYPPHVMPSFASLSKAQVDALFKFLTKGS